MEGWQQRRLGSMGIIRKRRIKEEERKNERSVLTLTGLLMEGPGAILGEIHHSLSRSESGTPSSARRC
jgi:hypothetical protein